ncbi:MAG: hypothetical protein A2015_13935 [Spirochaetes bacterium GWF1_31_7]|nr:MAG: hypothetical protein A2Y30_03815 [Spirochaetes bacterium GWE1_32_154]OHD48142.1 MAG: hypothetical protein A2Y29_10920 [Spirochaetes bacterium GWE2_31_10]OHD50503.1 MAG: hypothetical protein A2015_13935 [Spirochaetes bacterium GWF1_31_7]OHD72896.1 MAG: hypothetical protein A2355_11120 [Spirochaetes bacterium RIFOXYB1_FULL_32_8]HBD94692.1 hypothetical protein [Spirochaetia bacterium]
MITKQLYFLIPLLILISCQPEKPETQFITTLVEQPDLNVFTKTLITRYVEQYDDNGPVYSKSYSGDGSLSEYCEYKYDNQGRNNLVLSYNSETTSDDSYMGKYVYTFDGTSDSITRGEIIDKLNNAVLFYDATYNQAGKYVTYILKDGDGTVIESRVSTYDTSGKYYQTETYYSDEAQKNMIEKYTCSYDPDIPGRYVKEIKYFKVTHDITDPDADEMEYTDYESEVTYQFSWNSLNSNMHYLQQSFDSSGDLMDIIQYRFNNDGDKISRSYYSTGRLQSLRTYLYDDGFMINETHYNGNNAIINLFEYKLYDNDKAESFYEEVSYSFDYADGKSSSFINTDRKKWNLTGPGSNYIQ